MRAPWRGVRLTPKAESRGRITGDDWRRPELPARWRGWFWPYLAARIERARCA